MKTVYRLTTESKPKRLGSIVYVLMVPLLMVLINQSMFMVALPAVRDTFRIEPDTVSWTVIAFTLAFMMFMPIYGRLGDGLGKRRLLLIGIAVSFSGTLLTLLAPNLPLLLLGHKGSYRKFQIFCRRLSFGAISMIPSTYLSPARNILLVDITTFN